MLKSVMFTGGAAVGLMVATAAVAGTMAPGSYAGGSGPVGYGPGTPTAEDYPPNAQPGQCFAKVLVPEVTETYTEQVLVSPEKTVTKVIPGTCGYEDKTVVVREPSFEYVTIPATYKTVTETVVVKPGGSHTETIPPVYETVTEQILVRDGYTVWRPGSTVAGYNGGDSYGGGKTDYVAPPPSAYAGTGAAPNPAYGGLPTKVLATGEVLCLVQVPPEYKTITKQVLKVPGRIVEVPYPPETTVVSRQVVDIPAHVEKKEIPGETKIIKIKVCTPDQTQTATIPPEYKTVTKIKTISPSKFEWKTVDCKTDVVHAGYTPPATGYAPPPPPIVKTYGQEPAPPHHYYHPPVKRTPPVAYVPPKKTYAPPPAYTPPTKGKVCHQTCDDGPPSATYMPTATPPAYTPPPPKTYVQSSMSVPSVGGGDRAVANLQAALAAKGYYDGPQNGLFTQSTMSAMVKYQHDNHLAEGRYTGETANALGITR
jgi:hypothetical protein